MGERIVFSTLSTEGRSNNSRAPACADPLVRVDVLLVAGVREAQEAQPGSFALRLAPDRRRWRIRHASMAANDAFVSRPLKDFAACVRSLSLLSLCCLLSFYSLRQSSPCKAREPCCEVRVGWRRKCLRDLRQVEVTLILHRQLRLQENSVTSSEAADPTITCTPCITSGRACLFARQLRRCVVSLSLRRCCRPA